MNEKLKLIRIFMIFLIVKTMDQFETWYNDVILPSYGKPISSSLKNKLPHYLSINSRVDMTTVPVYVFDPIGCTDADDGFSVYYSDNNLYLAIFIADPTEHIEPHSELWNTITERVLTRYPSNRAPIHMMPDEIISKATLSTECDRENKDVIAIITQIDKTTYLPIGETNLVFATITVSKTTQFAYYKASIDLYIKLGLKISTALQTLRKSSGAIIVEEPVSTITYGGNFKKDTKLTGDLRKMIAEFAIFVNTFIAKYLSSLNLSDYCHFTSPIRRMSDCVCHYLVKYIYLNKNNIKVHAPFTQNQLQQLINKCQNAAKEDKKLSFIDRKFRLLQGLYNLIAKNEYPILTLKYNGYTGLYLNFTIIAINDHRVTMSYAAKLPNYAYLKFWQSNPITKIKISQINPFDKFDSNILPEVFSFIENPY